MYGTYWDPTLKQLVTESTPDKWTLCPRCSERLPYSHAHSLEACIESLAERITILMSQHKE